MIIDFAQAIVIPFNERHKLPKTSGVYVVKQADAVLYVGRAEDIHKRWKKHNQALAIEQHGEGVEIFCFLMSVAELEQTEFDFIRALRPSLNKLLVPTIVVTTQEQLPPLCSQPGFTPLPSDPALLTDEDVAAICGDDVDGVMRDLVRLIRQHSTASSDMRNGTTNG